MNNQQICKYTSDAVPLYLPHQLFLKPVARLNVSINLPPLRGTDKSVSNWEIMEKLRLLIKPEEFSVLKVTKSTLEFIRFEAEIDDKSRLDRVIKRLENQNMKLKNFSETVRVRVVEAKLDFPNRHSWDTFFRDAKNMDEMKPGERPDTIHLSHLPIKWFVPKRFQHDEEAKPSEKVLYKIFEKFGAIRHVDIPICDPYRSKMKSHITGVQAHAFENDELFEGYVQFKEYIGFTRAMDAFRGMKLMKKEDDKAVTVNITVDFDKTKHLSDASIRRREIVRDRLVSQDRDREEKLRKEKEEEERKEQAKRQKEIDKKNEKERRQREREERRKAKHLAKLKLKEKIEVNEKVAKEQQKLLKAQKKLEALRLIGELFSRVYLKHQQKNSKKKKHPEKMVYKNELLGRMKKESLEKVEAQRKKLHRAVDGHAVLKSILTEAVKEDQSSSGSSDAESVSPRTKPKHKKKTQADKNITPENESNENFTPYPVEPFWMDYHAKNMYPFSVYVPQIAGPSPGFFPTFRGKGYRGSPSNRSGFPRRRGSKNWRGWGRGRFSQNQYTPEMEAEYYKYFSKFIDDHDRRSRSRSPKFSRARSRSRNRSRSLSRRRSRSRSRRHSRSYSRDRSRRKTRSRSPSRNRSRRRSRSRSRSRSRVSARRSRNSSARGRTPSPRSKTRTPPPKRKSRSVTPKRKSRSKTPKQKSPPSKSKEKSKRRSRSSSTSYRSIDSSKFISPSRLRLARSRSKSWSRLSDLEDVL